DLARNDEIAILAAKADRAATRLIELRHDLLVDRSGKNHLDNLDGRLVGDAQPAGKLALDAEPRQHRADLRTAAMHDDGIESCLLEQNDIAGKFRTKRFIAHGMTAIFHDDRALVIKLHEGERFGKDARPVECLGLVCLVWHGVLPCSAPHSACGLYPSAAGSASEAISARSSAMPDPFSLDVARMVGWAATWRRSASRTSTSRVSSSPFFSLAILVSTI